MATTNETLRRYIERIERIEEEKRALAADIAAVYAEAKANGFDPKVMRKLVAERRMKEADRAELEALMETYRAALGDYQSTPLGTAAIKGVEARAA